jgi:predicted O-linked N-acetylglucosamine transferase (SPINDLY family)
VPNSYLLIKGSCRRGVHAEVCLTNLAAAAGVSAERLKILADRQEVKNMHRADLAIADVVLDTYPYNGATTTMETLWMGIPIVTQGGRTVLGSQ